MAILAIESLCGCRCFRSSSTSRQRTRQDNHGRHNTYRNDIPCSSRRTLPNILRTREMSTAALPLGCAAWAAYKLSSTSHVRYGVFLFQALLQCTSLMPVAFGGKVAEVVGSRGLARFQRRKKQTRVIGGRLNMNHCRCMHEERRRCMHLKEPSCGRYQGFYRTHLLASPTCQSQIHRHDNSEKSSHFIARSNPRR